MPSVIPDLQPIDNTMGAVFIGLLIATFLEGVLTLQVYIYFTNFQADRRLLKSLVAAVWLLDTLHLIVVCTMQYSYLITNYANPEALKKATWGFDTSVILTSLIALMIQLYFTWRTWVLTKSVTVAIAIGTLSLAGFGAGIASGVETFLLTFFSKFVKFRWLVGLWLGCSAACDIVVAAALCFTLWRSRTGFKQTDSILTRLIIWTLNTGLLTSIVAVMDLVCFATMNNLVHFAFNIMLGKLYANMFVAVLNHRMRTRGLAHATSNGLGLDFDSQGPHSVGLGPKNLQMKGGAPTGNLFGKIGTAMNVRIMTTKETTTFPPADTPPTPLTPLGNAALGRYRSASDSEHKSGTMDVEELGDLGRYSPELDREKNILPHFSSVGEEC